MSADVLILDADPDLGVGLDALRLAAARQEVRAPSTTVPRGAWPRSAWPTGLTHGLGMLVLEGALIRQIGLDGRSGAELLGAGDVVRPWQQDDHPLLGPAGWSALTRTRMALMDVDFIRSLAPYPEVVGALMGRSVRRSRNFAVNMVIIHQPRVDTRVRMLLWHLADRWGTVRRDGVLVALPLTHELLASLVAARRPTVSTALSELARDGSVERVSDGWLLRGTAPDELLATGEPVSG